MELRLKKRITGGLILLAAALIIIPLFFNHSMPSSELQLSAEIPDRPAKPGNLALPMPPKEATVPASARIAGNVSDNSQNRPSRIVFEQIQSLGAGNNNNVVQKPTAAGTPANTIVAPALPPVVASQTATVLASPANPGNVPQKTAVAQAAPASNTTQMTANVPNNAAPSSPMNIAELEQQTTTPALSAQKTLASESAPVNTDEPGAAQSATHKKSAKNNNSHTTKAQHPAKSQNTAPNPEAWAVQLGSFSDKLNADKLVKKLQAEGFPAYSRTSKTAHGDLIRVLVGPELHRADANSLLEKLQKQLSLQGMVVKGGG
ncbi:MAG TPA: SPOR domain-containing protein [Gammaproteobacteria bacterium]|nr:SPOR domain-containing protein [Gammaproteobacteria bacterium]